MNKDILFFFLSRSHSPGNILLPFSISKSVKMNQKEQEIKKKKDPTLLSETQRENPDLPRQQKPPPNE